MNDAQKARFVNALEDAMGEACLVAATPPSTDGTDMDALMLIAELRQEHRLQSTHEIQIMAADDLAENTDSESSDEEGSEDVAGGADGRSAAANDDGARGSDGAGDAGGGQHGPVDSSPPASGEDGEGACPDGKTAASPPSSPRLPFHVRAAAWKQRLRDAADNRAAARGSTFGMHQAPPAHQDDSNTEFIGSTMDRTSRRSSSQTETAWRSAGSMQGLQVFGFDHWKPTYDPAATLTGVLSSCRCYIALKTERTPPNSPLKHGAQHGAQQSVYSIHYVIGCHSSPEEQATACYKAIELRSYLWEASLTREEAFPTVIPDGAGQQKGSGRVGVRAEAGAVAGTGTVTDAAEAERVGASASHHFVHGLASSEEEGFSPEFVAFWKGGPTVIAFDNRPDADLTPPGSTAADEKGRRISRSGSSDSFRVSPNGSPRCAIRRNSSSSSMWLKPKTDELFDPELLVVHDTRSGFSLSHVERADALETFETHRQRTAFILDTGRDIYTFSGELTTAFEKVKAQICAREMRDTRNNCTVVDVAEEEAFLRHLEAALCAAEEHSSSTLSKLSWVNRPHLLPNWREDPAVIEEEGESQLGFSQMGDSHVEGMGMGEFEGEGDSQGDSEVEGGGGEHAGSGRRRTRTGTIDSNSTEITDFVDGATFVDTSTIVCESESHVFSESEDPEDAADAELSAALRRGKSPGKRRRSPGKGRNTLAAVEAFLETPVATATAAPGAWADVEAVDDATVKNAARRWPGVSPSPIRAGWKEGRRERRMMPRSCMCGDGAPSPPPPPPLPLPLPITPPKPPSGAVGKPTGAFGFLGRLACTG